MRVREAIKISEEFIKDLMLNNLSDKTIESYRADINSLFMYLAREGQKVLNKTTMKSYFADMYMRNLAAASIKRRANVLSRIYPDFMPNIRIKGDKKLPVVLSESELSMLKNSLETERESLIFDIMANTGIRISELHNMNKNDLMDRKLKIKGKGSKERTVPVPYSLNEKLKTVFDGSNEPLLINNKSQRLSIVYIRKILKNAAKKAGISEEFSPHCLRHGFATRLLNKGMNIYSLSKLLGHSKIETTVNYLRLADKQLEKEYHETWEEIK